MQGNKIYLYMMRWGTGPTEIRPALIAHVSEQSAREIYRAEVGNHDAVVVGITAECVGDAKTGISAGTVLIHPWP